MEKGAICRRVSGFCFRDTLSSTTHKNDSGGYHGFGYGVHKSSQSPPGTIFVSYVRVSNGAACMWCSFQTIPTGRIITMFEIHLPGFESAPHDQQAQAVESGGHIAELRVWIAAARSCTHSHSKCHETPVSLSNSSSRSYSPSPCTRVRAIDNNHTDSTLDIHMHYSGTDSVVVRDCVDCSSPPVHLETVFKHACRLMVSTKITREVCLRHADVV